ncbi:hypothetical protein OESDEN_22000 [Oesophagostomum dentatum]|uniref:Glycosyl hydrolase family 13 catalytic domain-containing protein n=1 Tax=Oesophagostomum dentatum TaxID=61180 RepID=A0A0B1S0A9_OESDE|nr:hypothetical protein OESDEN_22000 [Oesophagostomum dentatum]
MVQNAPQMRILLFVSGLVCHIRSHRRYSALFASLEDATEGDKKLLAENGLDTIINRNLAEIKKDGEICGSHEGNVAKCVHGILSDVLRYHEENPSVWPQWELGNQYVSRIASRVDSRAHGELLLMLQLLLPGTNNFYYGDELGMVDLDSDSQVPRQRGAMQWADAYEGGFTSAEQSQVPINEDYKQYNWEVSVIIA